MKVKIVKAKEETEIIKNNEYCDIVAQKSGTITKIIAQNGTAVVNIGDTVKAGDILIKGIMEGKYTEPRRVHSLGIIEAEINYEKTKEVFFEKTEYIETGKKENKYEINYKDKKIQLYRNLSTFEIFKTEYTSKKFRLLENFYLPISITKIINKEQTKKIKKFNLNEAIEFAVEELTLNLEKEIPSIENIIDKNVKTAKNEASVVVTLNYKTIEEIGKSKK